MQPTPNEHDATHIPDVLTPYLDPERNNVLRLQGFLIHIYDEIPQHNKQNAVPELPLPNPMRMFKVHVTVDSGFSISNERRRLLLVNPDPKDPHVQNLLTVLDELEREGLTQSTPQPVDHWVLDDVELLLVSDHLKSCSPISHDDWQNFHFPNAVKLLTDLALTVQALHNAGFSLGRVWLEDIVYDRDDARVALTQLGQLIPLHNLEPNTAHDLIQADIRALGRGLLEAASRRPLEDILHEIEHFQDFTDWLLQHNLALPALTQVFAGTMSEPESGLLYPSMHELICGLVQIRTEMLQPLTFSSSIQSTCGNYPSRRTDQDSCGIAETRTVYHGQRNHIGFYCVADGVGGEAAGELASQLAVSSSLAAFHRMVGFYTFDTIQANVTTLARALVKVAAQRLAIAGETEPEVHRGATTFTCILIAGNSAGIGHVGDSRAALLRNNTLTWLTRDHNLANIKVATGELTPEQANASSDDQRRLSRFLDTLTETPNSWIDGFDPSLLSSLLKTSSPPDANALQSGSFDLFFQPSSIARNLKTLHHTSPPTQLQTGFDDHLFDTQRSSSWIPARDSDTQNPISTLLETQRTRRIFSVTDEDDARTLHLPLQADDVLILMSDGVYGELSQDDLTHYLSNHMDPEECSQAILNGILSSIATDNIGFILIRANDSKPNLTLPPMTLKITPHTDTPTHPEPNPQESTDPQEDAAPQEDTDPENSADPDDNTP